MEPEAILNLFDSSWFGIKTFQESIITSNSHDGTYQPNPESSSKTACSSLSSGGEPPHHSCIISKASYSSQDSVLMAGHLQSVPSEKEISPEIPTIPRIEKPRNKKRRGLSKSLSELEFEELKGFTDLGFLFTEKDRDSSLADIVPGIQRLGRIGGGVAAEEEWQRARPYLSEAWQVLNWSDERRTLMNWRFPDGGNEIAMKDSLKWWAQTVASAVR